MSFDYSAASRDLQDRFDTRRLADRLAEVKVHDRFTASDRDFIAARDMFFLASVDSDGQPTCSYKGGDPGFVNIVPNYTEEQFIVRVEAKAIYPNCPRYIHQYRLVERSRFVPRRAEATPIPPWKESEWARDVLPANDPARARASEPRR